MRLYYLKTKITNSHKVIYSKKNKLYKIRLCIFFPVCRKHWILSNKNNIHSSNDNIITPPPQKKKSIKKTTDLHEAMLQPPTVSLTFVNKIPFFGILCQSSFWSQFLGFVLFLCVSFFCRINLDYFVLLVFCVDLLKTKFIISLCELRVDHRFLLLDMNIFLFQFEFSFVESTKAFTESIDRAKCLSCRQKSPIIPPPDLRLNFLLKGTAYQNQNQPAIGLLFQQLTKKPA